MRTRLMIPMTAIVCAFAFAWILRADDGANRASDLASELQVALNRSLAACHVDGCSAAVLLCDETMWRGVGGTSNGAEPVSSDMLFNMGSVTKNYVAPLILQLAEEGIISLDDTVVQWLPEQSSIDGSITILQLLNQRSGLCNVTDRADLWDAVWGDPMRIWEPGEVLEGYIDEPCLPPGTGWHYSNTGYLLLGMIVERATGERLSEQLRSRFLEPLHLSRTFFCVEEAFPEDVPVCRGWYDLDGDGIGDDVTPFRTGIYSVLWASAAMFSTAEDLARWVDALFGGDVLSSESLERMTTAYSIVPDSGGIGYGLGVNLYGTEGIGHSGRTFGYLSLFLYLPSQETTIVVMINGDDALCLDAIASALTVVVLGAAD